MVIGGHVCSWLAISGGGFVGVSGGDVIGVGGGVAGSVVGSVRRDHTPIVIIGSILI